MADATRDLKVVISGDTGQAEESLQGFSGSLKNIGIIAAGLGLERVGEQILSLGKQAVEFSVDYASNLEQARIAFDAFTGSAAKGQKALQEVTEFARKTPFELPEVVSAGKMLLGFGFTTDELLPKLKEAGSLAAATHTPMTVAIDLFARAREGIFNLREYGQFGISREALEQFGVSFDKAGGAINKSQLLPALEKLIQSRFGDMLKKESETFGGTVNNIKDDLGRLASAMIGVDPSTGNIIKGGIFDHIKQSAQGFLSWLDAHQGDIVKTFNDIAATIGDVFTKLEPILKPVFKLVMQFFSDVENRKAVTVAVLAVIGLAFAALAVAVIAASWEIIAILYLIGGTVFILKEAWDSNFMNIRGIVQGGWEFIKAIFKLGVDFIVNDFRLFKDIFTGNWKKVWEDVKQIFVGVIDDIKGVFKGFADFANGIINGILDGVRGAANAVSGAGKSPPHKALGGVASGLTLVGERGPELVSLPNGSYVHTNEQSQQMMGGGGTTININNPTVRSDNDLQQIINAVTQALGRQGELVRLGAL
jgi:phage-related protein